MSASPRPGFKTWLLMVVLLLLCWQCRMILYGIDQGLGQLMVIRGAQPVEDVLQDPEFPDSLKQKLLLIQEIRQFAIDSLGINDSENYRSVYDQQGEPILWVVTACDPYSLDRHYWHYPFLGKLGYMGAFKRYKAEAEQLRLHQKGFDTNLGDVSAWSTLGWFEDPILSNMLQRSEGSLARLIIHELTHGTLYVPGDADFSENLATFVGDNGAYAFLAWKFGKEAPQYRDYQGRMKDIKRYAAHVLAGAQRLDSLYNAMDPEWPIAVKDSLKFGMIAAIMADADTVSFYNAKRYRFVLRDDFRPNNTFFMRYKMYREQQNQLEQEFREQFNGDFERYLQHLKAHYGNASGS